MRFPESPLGITLMGALMGVAAGCVSLALTTTWQWMFG